MKKILLLVFIVFSSGIILPQSYFIKGQVVDSLKGDPLISATVLLTRIPDSVKTGASADKLGNFTIKNVNPGKYLLSVSFVGYNTYRQRIDVLNKPIESLKITLTPKALRTTEVEITGKIPTVEQKNDTVIYNAQAFKINKDANTQDLITKMPGIEVQDGKVQAHGEDVKRVLVDGKQFFGNDPNAVLRNLPAEIVEKVQVFDQQSDQAQFTGFDDGNTSKTINVITKNRMRQGTFGKFSGGYGSEDMFRESGNINFFNNDQRITLLGLTNNVNEQNFSIEDIIGVMSGGSGFGGGRGGFGGGGFGGGRSFVGMFSGGGMGGGGGAFNRMGFGGGGAGDFLVNAKNGLTKTYSFGSNYSDKWLDKIDMSGSYFFNSTNNNAETETFRQLFLANSNQNYNENNLSTSDNTNHRFNMRVDYQIDSTNSITFRPNVSFQLNNGVSSISGITTQGDRNLNSTSNNNNSKLSAFSGTGDLLYRHKFETRGRTISIGLNAVYNNNNGDKNLFSQTLYFNNMVNSDTLDQKAHLDKNGYTYSSNIVYTEPISETGQIQLNYRLSYSKDKSDKRTFDYSPALNQYTDLNTNLSNTYNKQYVTQSYGTGYRWQQGNLSIMANINYNIARLTNSQVFPFVSDIGRTFYSFLPSFMLRYNISRSQNLRINYSARNNAPSVDQLQDVLDNTNPLQLSIGNPFLKQDSQHSLGLFYTTFNPANMQSFFFMLNASMANDYIGNKTIIAVRDTTVLSNIVLNRGSQITLPENLDGQYSIRSFIAYSLPVSLIKSNVNFNLSANYSRTPGIINDIMNYSKTAAFGLGLVISSRINEDLDFTISSRSSFNNVKNSSQKNYDDNYFNQNSSLRFYWMFWKGFLIQSDVSHQYNNGLSAQYNQNPLIWNFSLGKKILANDAGEIRLSINDILNKNSNVQRTVTDSYYEDSRSNVLSSYVMLTFTYNVRSF